MEVGKAGSKTHRAGGVAGSEGEVDLQHLHTDRRHSVNTKKNFDSTRFTRELECLAEISYH